MQTDYQSLKQLKGSCWPCYADQKSNIDMLSRRLKAHLGLSNPTWLASYIRTEEGVADLSAPRALIQAWA